MKFVLIINFCLCSIVFGALAYASEINTRTLTMFTWSQHLDPIIYSSEQTADKLNISEYHGIIADLLNSFSTEFSQSITVEVTGRLRGERELYKGNFDFTIISPSWLEHPQELLYSTPIYIHREFLYSLEVITEKSTEKSIKSKRVCTQSGFTYPKLERYFQSGLASRLDSSNEEISFQLLMRGRCDYVVTNEFVADAIIEKNNLNNTIFSSKFIVDQAEFVFAFHPKHEKLLASIDNHIKYYVASGKMQGKIIIN